MCCISDDAALPKPIIIIKPGEDNICLSRFQSVDKVLFCKIRILKKKNM